MLETMSTEPTSRKTVRGACPHDCPDRCVWDVTVEDGTAVELQGVKDHPFTRGGLCAKVNRFLDDRVYNPDRLLHPLKRTGARGEGRFERVTWDEALDAVAARLRRIIESDGPTAILPYSYMGTQGLLQATSLDRRFFARLGATRLVRKVCGRAGGAGVTATMGTIVGMLPEDIVHSRYIVLWGTNTVVTNLHLWSFIAEAKKRGATVVVVDPARTRTAARADRHIQPRPGTDAALALGMMHVIVAEGLHDADYVEQYTLGFEQLRERIAEYTPERAAEITGVPADEIVELARAYATTRPSAIRMLIGMEHRANGAMTYRTVACLPALVGAWRDRGGGLLYLTSGLFSEALQRDALEMNDLEDPSVRSVNMVQLGQALTDASLDPPIRALVVYNSNPAVIVPNRNRVFAGLARDDLFTVVIEQFMTDTARYADYIFPATTQVEHLDLLWSWGHTYLCYNEPAIAPVGEAVPNTEFFRRLAAHMGFDEPYLFESDEELIRTALASDHPYLEGITLERLQSEGSVPLNLPSDWRPFAEGGFPTPSGKCEFYSHALLDQGLDPLPGYEAPAESLGGDPALTHRYPLNLLTRKATLHFINSSYGNVPRCLEAEKEPRLDLHSSDAASRGITDGDTVRVFNDRGSVHIRASVGDGVRPGVVVLPFGWWESAGPGGASANALTADGLSDAGGGGDFYDTLVEVEKVTL
jgi:anaerobic selenocysteine-containing dehydrogenase